MSFGAGQVIADRYELTRQLGNGGMGRVFLAFDRRLDRFVALKVSEGLVSDTLLSSKAFGNEAQIAAQFANPNLVAVFDTGNHEGHAFIVMEFVNGETLADEMSRGPISESRSLSVVRDVLQGLSAAHEAGVVHLDIKPSNVLITGQGVAKLGDFGIAHYVHETNPVPLVGTPQYVAPERTNGGLATPASDIYSVGVLWREALQGEEPSGLLNREAIRRALEPEPEARFQSGAEMLQFLDTRGRSGGTDPADNATRMIDSSDNATRLIGPVDNATRLIGEPVRSSTETQVLSIVEPKEASQTPTHPAERARWNPRLIMAILATLAVVVAVIALAVYPIEESPEGSTVPTSVVDSNPVPPLDKTLDELSRAINT